MESPLNGDVLYFVIRWQYHHKGVTAWAEVDLDKIFTRTAEYGQMMAHLHGGATT